MKMLIFIFLLSGCSTNTTQVDKAKRESCEIYRINKNGHKEYQSICGRY